MTLGWPASLAPTRLGASQQQLWQTDRAGQSTMDIIMIRSRAVLPPPSWHGFLLSCKPRAWQQAEGTQTGCRDQQWPPGQCSALLAAVLSTQTQDCHRNGKEAHG